MCGLWDEGRVGGKFPVPKDLENVAFVAAMLFGLNALKLNYHPELQKVFGELEGDTQRKEIMRCGRQDVVFKQEGFAYYFKYFLHVFFWQSG